MDTTKPVLLRRNDVEARTGLARATIYNMVRLGKFPAPIPLTESGRAVGWLESDVDAYLQNRIDAARPKVTGGE
jgi:prophage regulatory protein